MTTPGILSVLIKQNLTISGTKKKMKQAGLEVIFKVNQRMERLFQKGIFVTLGLGVIRKCSISKNSVGELNFSEMWMEPKFFMVGI